MRNLALLACLLVCLSSSARSQAPVINGDFNGNGIAGPEDLIELVNSFGLPVSTGSGDLIWAKRVFSPSFDSAHGAVIGSEGQIYVTGSFSDGAVFGEGEANETTLTTNNSSNSFLARYTSSGELTWVRRSRNSGTGASSSETGHGIAARESDGAIWQTGTFTNTSTFGIGGATEAMVATAGLTDVFLARFSADGDLETLTRGGGSGVQEGYIVTGIPDGTHAVLGTADTAVTFGEGENEITLDSPATRTFFLVKFNPDGTPAWGKSINSTLFNNLFNGKMLPDGSIVVTAYFDDPIVLGEGEPNETSLNPIETMGGLRTDDFLIALFNSDGTLAWARSAGGTGDDRGTGLTILPDNSGFVCVGTFEGVATFGAGTVTERILTAVDGQDLFVAKYNLQGDLVWARSAGGQGPETPYRVAAGLDGSTVVVGSFENDCTFGAGGPNEITLESEAGFAGFVAKFVSDGSLLWAKGLTGPGNAFGRDVAVDADGNAVVVGSFTQSVVLGEGEPGETTLESGGNTPTANSIFISKFGP